MEEAFAAGSPPVGVGATACGADDDGTEAAPRRKPADIPDASGDATGGTDDSCAAPEPDGGEPSEGSASGNGHDASTFAEGEGGPEPVTGDGACEERPTDHSIADAIGAMNAAPTAAGGPRVIVQHVGPVTGDSIGAHLAPQHAEAA